MLKKLATGAATIGLLLTSAVPVLADTTVEIKDNGENSTNTAVVTDVCLQGVKQVNNANSYVNVNQKGNTGGNKIGGTTGGDASITTGDVTNTATVTVTGGNNTAEMPDCSDGETDVDISGNGPGSTNTAAVSDVQETRVRQRTNLWSTAKVKQKGNTGRNRIHGTTGDDASATITTEAVENTTDVTVEAGHNTL